MMFPDARLLIFAKAPVPGQVKTRLIPTLSAAEAARLHARLVRHTLMTATAVKLCPVQLWCAPSTEHPFFQTLASSFGVATFAQSGDELGARMATAFAEALHTAASVVLIGTDCPSYTPIDLHEALNALAEGNDAVLGPMQDGGYGLIGLRRNAPELFHEMPWGTAGVLALTRMRLARLQMQWHELPIRWDVDRPEDLLQLKEVQLLD